MARIAGIDLPREKRIEIGLTYIFGIGVPTAQKILSDFRFTAMQNQFLKCKADAIFDANMTGY